MATKTTKTTKKYRPVLSGTAIDHILSLCKKEVPLSSESMSLIGTLAPFQAKIQNDALKEAYSVTPRESLEEQLGLELPANVGLPKEKVWEVCYSKYKTNPKHCSLVEIQGAKEHMYLNGLMSNEEIIEFEKATDTKKEV